MTEAKFGTVLQHPYLKDILYFVVVPTGKDLRAILLTDAPSGRDTGTMSTIAGMEPDPALVRVGRAEAVWIVLDD